MLIHSFFPIRSIQYLLAICAAVASLSCTKQDAALPSYDISERPRVIRSVLDGEIRILSIAFPDNVWLAYSTEKAQVFKLWRGELLLEGPVYTQAHGPQPQSQGKVYYDMDDQHWQLEQSDSTITVDAVYDGHIFEGETFALLYHFKHGDKNIEVREYPVVKRENEVLVFERLFKIQNLDEGETLRLGEFAFGNGENRTQTHFDSFEQKGPQKIAAEHPGEEHIAGSDCVSCHNPRVDTVGPSYEKIAQRYDDSTANRARLKKKILEGGSGTWGEAFMTPHPDLSDDIVDSMLDYIFSLHIQTDKVEQSWTLGIDGHALAFSEKLQGEPEQGWLVYKYLLDSTQLSAEDILALQPYLVAHAPTLHFTEMPHFGQRQENFALRARTILNIDKEKTLKLRLISDDGSALFLNGEKIISNWGFHGPEPEDAELVLKPGTHQIDIVLLQAGGGAALSLQWEANGEMALFPASETRLNQETALEVYPRITDTKIVKSIPGDTLPLNDVHPSFYLFQARPESFQPMVGALDLLPDGRLVVSTWDTEGGVYLVENYLQSDPQKIQVKQIASGLAEPLGLKVVDNDIYVMQKQELTKLVDLDGDEIIDLYACVSNDWSATSNFHEFGFGIHYENAHFYIALATAILPGGASAQPQAPDRGKVLKIAKDGSLVETFVTGLRTPNGVGTGIDGKFFITDNQGDWLPASKVVEITEGHFYGARSVDPEGTKNIQETLPVVWLPQDEIGNSPGEPIHFNVGPYQNQMLHGEVTHGGLKRVAAERINGRLQGAVFRFSQGLEAGVNRLQWAPDESLIVGGIGNPGNWGHKDKLWYGLQRLVYNGQSTFEMLAISSHSNGFEIQFTEAIAEGQNVSAEDFYIEQFRFVPTEAYGGPKVDLQALTVKHFSLSDDRTRAQLELDGLKEGHVVYFRIQRPFHSENNHSLWTTEAWYTLNAIPQGKPLVHNPKYRVHHNELNEVEQQQGWSLLFNGRDLSTFRNYNQTTRGAAWTIENDSLHLQAKAKGVDNWQNPAGGDLVITEKPYENFELYLEWKVQRNGNSGILYNVVENPELEFPFLSGPEFQILDNSGHPDGKIEKHRAGDNYDLIATQFVTVSPAEEWNRARIIVNDGKVQHWLNGFKLIETRMWTPEWDQLIAGSKFADWPHFAKARSGHIVLQDHGDAVWFRNIKIRELD